MAVLVLAVAALEPPGTPWILGAVEAACALACAVRAASSPDGRAGWLALGVGLALWTAGDLVYTAIPGLATPSVADALWLAYYLPSYAAVVILGRRRLASASFALWLDGLVAALALSAIAAALVVGPVLATSEGSAAAVIVNVAYPVGDLVLAGLVVLVLGLGGWRLDLQWTLLSGGLLLTALADGAYLGLYAGGWWRDGTVLDGLWPLATLMLAAAALLTDGDTGSPVPVRGRRLLAGPAVGSLTALGILAIDETRSIGALAVALALGSLTAVSVRMWVTLTENQRMLEGLRVRAATDPLTALPNHREFHDRLHSEVERARRAGSALSLAVIDLDHFKRVNDEQGHPAGDRALVAVAELLRSRARAGDTLGRLGGEEFGWILPEAEELGAWQAIDRTRLELQALEVPDVNLPTMSAGICELRHVRSPSDASELLRLADAALYAAKAQGRNAVVVYAPERAEVPGP